MLLFTDIAKKQSRRDHFLKKVVPRQRTRVRGRIGRPRSEEDGGAEEKPLVWIDHLEKSLVSDASGSSLCVITTESDEMLLYLW